MDKHQVLLVRFICVVALVVGAAKVTTATIYTCYHCSDIPNDSLPYDSECSEYSYDGLTTTTVFEVCFIEIQDEGYMRRGTGSSIYADGDCVYESGYTRCYCEGDLCNTESYCSQCGYPKPTPGTSTTTEVTTTSPGILSCYECIGCPSVDSSTPVFSDASYLSCTTVVLNDANVIRGGSYDHHPDGECAQDDGILSCWCSSNLCNNIKI
ncbi:unnamed protein product [Meganyctiphanes norvegica]|uniref:Uncharacterized protein n=1 Tax=Meganyctiphanes norvegica TaxID=48144 RepID=A0AAV2SE41_MEGNR